MDRLLINNSRIVSFLIRHVSAILIVLGGVLALSGWQINLEINKNLQETLFNEKVDALKGRIERRLEFNENVLMAGKALFAANNNNVNRETWRNFVKTLSLDENYPSTQAYSFTIYLPTKQSVTELEKKMRAEGFANFSVFPLGERKDYSSLIFLEPFNDQNKRAFGYDMLSDPTRRLTMEAAAINDQPMLTSKVTSVTEPTDFQQPGFLLYVPVYKNGSSIDSVEQRQNNLYGFVVGAYRAHNFMQVILEDYDTGLLDFEIYDSNKISVENLIFDSDAKLHSLDANNPQTFSSVKQINIYGKIWLIYASSDEIIDNSFSLNWPLVMFILGLLFMVIALGNFSLRIIKNLNNLQQYS